ncbi:MAG TPA: phosphoribosyltransferase family protein, partial [Chloroflexia bacterium]|nr:phosphoribosyltransferase family protein [Chloroflexia bacterium]
QPLAALLVDGLKAHALWAELQAKPPVIVPVPLHLHREKERGFNQCKLLAQEVSAATGWMILPHLQRSRETRSQVGLDADARRENVREAFAWLSDAGDAPDRVLLIDDVCTTGATLSECVAALKQMGSVEVHVAAVARAAGPEADAAI